MGRSSCCRFFLMFVSLSVTFAGILGFAQLAIWKQHTAALAALVTASIHYALFYMHLMAYKGDLLETPPILLRFTFRTGRYLFVGGLIALLVLIFTKNTYPEHEPAPPSVWHFFVPAVIVLFEIKSSVMLMFFAKEYNNPDETRPLLSDTYVV